MSTMGPNPAVAHRHCFWSSLYSASAHCRALYLLNVEASRHVIHDSVEGSWRATFDLGQRRWSRTLERPFGKGMRSLSWFATCRQRTIEKLAGPKVLVKGRLGPFRASDPFHPCTSWYAAGVVRSCRLERKVPNGGRCHGGDGVTRAAPLGTWVQTQRKACTAKLPRLSPERIARL